MKKIGAFFGLISITCLVLSGCGGGSSKSNTQSTSATKTLSSIAVSGKNSAKSVVAGTTLQLVAVGTYSDGTTADITSQVTWSTSDPAVATANVAGLLTAVKAGSVIASAKQGAITGAMTIAVNAATLSSISVSGGAALAAGLSEQLSAQATYSDSSTQTITSQVTWQSSDATVATVSASGMLTSLKAGTVTITASMNSVSGNTGVTVTTAVLTAINVGAQSSSLAVGSAEQVTATGIYSDSSTQNLTAQASWTVSDPTVATVSGAGLLASLKVGSVTVMATMSGVSGSATVAVTAASVSSITITRLCSQSRRDRASSFRRLQCIATAPRTM